MRRTACTPVSQNSGAESVRYGQRFVIQLLEKGLDASEDISSLVVVTLRQCTLGWSGLI